MNARYRVRPAAPWEWWLIGCSILEKWTGTHWEHKYSCSCRTVDHCIEWAEIASGKRPEFTKLIDYGQRWKLPKL